METNKQGIVAAIGKLIGQGFFFGVGLGITVVIVGIVARSVFIHEVNGEVRHTYKEPMEIVQPESKGADKFVFSKVEEMKTPGQYYFVGVITNKSSSAGRGLQIEVNLFDKNNKFVDQYSSYLSGTLNPGESRYFKIGCGCKDNPPAEHASYKLLVAGGY